MGKRELFFQDKDSEFNDKEIKIRKSKENNNSKSESKKEHESAIIFSNRNNKYNSLQLNNNTREKLKIYGAQPVVNKNYNNGKNLTDIKKIFNKSKGQGKYSKDTNTYVKKKRNLESDVLVHSSFNKINKKTGQKRTKTNNKPLFVICEEKPIEELEIVENTKTMMFGDSLIENKKTVAKKYDYNAKVFFSGFTITEKQEYSKMSEEIGLVVVDRVEDCKYLVTKYYNTNASQLMKNKKLKCMHLTYNFILDSYNKKIVLNPCDYIFNDPIMKKKQS